MEDLNNNNNVENNDNNNNGVEVEQQPGREEPRMTSQYITKFTSAFLFSILFFSFAVLGLKSAKHFCTPSYHNLLRIIASLYGLIITKNIVHFLLVYYNQASSKPAEITITTSDILIELGYFTLVACSYYYFVNRPDNCFNDNIYATIYLFTFILIGTINLSKYFLNLILIILCFPVLVCMFLQNPHDFYSRFGVDPEIINNLPTVKAEAQHCINCAICLEDIEIGHEILILKCPGKHFFHANCIKHWLQFKMWCPMCRNQNVF